MSFILTNHSLSPLTDINDPLLNSLSVTCPRLVECLSLGFGYHVEHHLFPAMSARHAPEVRALLRAHYPERYQSMPLLQATLVLHSSARVYKDATTLVDPRSGREWPALKPPPSAAALSAAGITVPAEQLAQLAATPLRARSAPSVPPDSAQP